VTRRDYERLAAALRFVSAGLPAGKSLGGLTLEAVAHALADALAADNPNFDRDRWLAACL
jgi:hypothetical protein